MPQNTRILQKLEAPELYECGSETAEFADILVSSNEMSFPTTHSPMVPSFTACQKGYDLKGQSGKAAIAVGLKEKGL